MFSGFNLVQLLAWICASGLAVASLTPGDELVRTGLPGQVEHVGAYFLSSLIIILAYPQRSPWLLGTALVAYAGTLELAQLFIEGRHSRLIDFAASSTGIILGLILGAFFKSRAPVPSSDSR